MSSGRLWEEYLFLWFPNQLPVFCLGIVLFHVYKRVSGLSFNDKSRLGKFLLLLSFLAMAYLLGEGPIFKVPRPWAYGFAFSLLAAGLMCYPILFIVNHLTVWIGKISYSCYLWHWFSISLVVAFKNRFFGSLLEGQPALELMITYAMVVLVTSSISFVTWKYIETKGILLGKKVVNRLSHPSVIISNDVQFPGPAQAEKPL